MSKRTYQSVWQEIRSVPPYSILVLLTGRDPASVRVVLEFELHSTIILEQSWSGEHDVSEAIKTAKAIVAMLPPDPEPPF